MIEIRIEKSLRSRLTAAHRAPLSGARPDSALRAPSPLEFKHLLTPTPLQRPTRLAPDQREDCPIRDQLLLLANVMYALFWIKYSLEKTVLSMTSSYLLVEAAAAAPLALAPNPPHSHIHMHTTHTHHDRQIWSEHNVDKTILTYRSCLRQGKYNLVHKHKIDLNSI